MRIFFRPFVMLLIVFGWGLGLGLHVGRHKTISEFADQQRDGFVRTNLYLVDFFHRKGLDRQFFDLNLFMAVLVNQGMTNYEANLLSIPTTTPAPNKKADRL